MGRKRGTVWEAIEVELHLFWRHLWSRRTTPPSGGNATRLDSDTSKVLCFLTAMNVRFARCCRLAQGAAE
jgi:hypothetical protein